MKNTITRAISIRQPFVELILRGEKKYEYRSRLTNIRERVYLYASLTPSDWAAGWRKVGKEKGELPAGVIVGTVQIVGCRYRVANKEYAYVLRNPTRLRSPLNPKNQPQPMFWRPQF